MPSKVAVWSTSETGAEAETACRMLLRRTPVKKITADGLGGGSSGGGTGFWTHVLNANIYAKGDGKRNVLNQIRHRVRKQETKVRDDSKVFESDQSELKTLRKEIL